MRARGRLFYGITLGYQGKHRRALKELTEARASVDPENKEERAAFFAAWADSNAHTGALDEAIAGYDAWYAVGRPSERAYAMSRIRSLVEQLDEAAVRRVYGRLENKEGPAAALVGARLAAQLDARGDRDGAEQVRSEVKDAREQLGMGGGGAAGEGAGGDPGRLGAILSLSGKRNRLGDFAMRGLTLASSAFDDRDASAGRLGFPRPFQLMVRDDASQAQGAAAGVDALAQAGAIGVVGPDDGRAVERAARRAGELGVPLVSLHPAAELLEGIDSPYVFHAVHSAEQRARALARAALAGGARDFAIFAPDNGYGRKVGEAFRQAVERGGGNVVVQERYPAGATSFATHVARLKKPFQALFVPDRARTLELVAPALAAANLIARPPGQKTSKRAAAARSGCCQRPTCWSRATCAAPAATASARCWRPASSPIAPTRASASSSPSTSARSAARPPRWTLTPSTAPGRCGPPSSAARRTAARWPTGWPPDRSTA